MTQVYQDPPQHKDNNKSRNQNLTQIWNIFLPYSWNFTNSTIQLRLANNYTIELEEHEIVISDLMKVTDPACAHLNHSIKIPPAQVCIKN